MAAHSRLVVLNRIIDQGLVPLAYHPDVETMKKMVAASFEGGSRVFEFTNRGDNAFWIFAELVRHFQKDIPDLIIGAGSILDAGTASLYLSCGANFIVGSVFNPDVARVCNRRKVAYMPGCMTANEISTAEEYGVEIVKVFPGEAAGGPGFIKAILGPTPWTKVMVTGGVEDNPDNIAAWFRAGAVAVGMGSNLFKKDLVKEGRYNEIAIRVANVLKWIRQGRGEKTQYSLDHVGFSPSTTATAGEIAAWYQDIFHLRAAEESSGYFLEGAGGGRFEIRKENSHERLDIAVSVSDFEDAVTELRGKGIELEDSPVVNPSEKSIDLKNPDPAGNRVRIIWRKP